MSESTFVNNGYFIYYFKLTPNQTAIENNSLCYFVTAIFARDVNNPPEERGLVGLVGHLSAQGNGKFNFLKRDETPASENRHLMASNFIGTGRKNCGHIDNVHPTA